MIYYVRYKVYTRDDATSKIEHGSSACTRDNQLAEARGLLSVQADIPCFISHLNILDCFLTFIVTFN